MKKRNLMVALAYTVTSLSMGASYSASAISAEKTPMEIVSMRTEYDKYFDNGDGTITAIMNTVPLHYYEDGKWIEIDNTLEINADGDYVNKSNSMNVTIASTTSPKSVENADDEGDMVQIEYNGYSISWDIINTQSEDSDSCAEAKIVSVNDAKRSKVSLSNEKLSCKASECFDKLKSEVVYDSFMENIDVSLALEASSVKETIILNDKEVVPDTFTYFLDTDGLTAKVNEDNSIGLTDKSGNNIFTIPAMYMFDSAEDVSEYNYDIETSLEAVDNGYLLTITPDKEWIASDERVYPIMIDPTVTTNITASSIFVKQSTPNSIYNDGYLRIGGYADAGNLQEAIVYSPSFNVNHMKVIKDAKLHLTFDMNLYTGDSQPIEVYSIRTPFTNPCWNTCGGDNVSSTYITEADVPDYYSEVEFDITNAVQAQLNYDQSYAGARCYGYKLKAKNDASKLYLAFSERSNYPGPYFEITYATNTAYTMEYTPYKYNDILPDTDHSNSMPLYNFQNSMNCYAYALQVYYSGNTSTSSYKLVPGEFGISHNTIDNINTYHDLKAKYTSFENDMKNPGSRYYPSHYVDLMQDFVDQQMHNDAAALGFNLNQFTFTTQNFSLPSSFNENSQRVIAMLTYYNSAIQKADFHFYVRNGSGTCPNGHGGSCSTWSHKSGNGKVRNTWARNENILLCDHNIKTYAASLVGSNSYSDVNYYTITQDANLYNSWHGYGHDDNSTGTPYRSYY